MRYIRTKDGKIYDTKDLTKCDDKRFPNGWFTKYGVPLVSIKEADTITELCDRFVYETNKGNHYVKDKTQVMNLFFDEKPIAYYGAIWTKKGLQFVARMNNEGVLELI